jgi:putative membrane protein
LIELLLFSLLGILLGTALGLLPGMNVNNILPMMLSLAIFLPPHYIAVLIISTAISQIFVSYIPSIFLGAPDADTSLSVLPGHRLLHEGRGYEAIKLTVIGGLGSLLVSFLAIYAFANYFTLAYELSRPYIHYAILLAILFMIFSEKRLKHMLGALAVISLSGLFGVITLGSSVVNQQNVLFPVLSGLFGISTIVISMSMRSKIPQQSDDDKTRLTTKNIFKSIALGSLAGIVVGFLPAIGVSQAATMVQYLGGMGDARNFLVSMSGIGTSNEVFSLLSLYLVGNPRSGASVAIGRILQPTSNDILMFAGTIIFAAGISAVLTLYLGRKIPKLLARLDYRKLSIAVLAGIVGMVFVATGLLGLLVAFTSTSIGLLCASLGVKRGNCMGVLLVPSVLFFSGLNPLVLFAIGV